MFIQQFQNFHKTPLKRLIVQETVYFLGFINFINNMSCNFSFHIEINFKRSRNMYHPIKIYLLIPKIKD